MYRILTTNQNIKIYIKKKTRPTQLCLRFDNPTDTRQEEVQVNVTEYYM